MLSVVSESSYHKYAANSVAGRTVSDVRHVLSN